MTLTRKTSGVFVTLEGGEGAGKTTQATRLAQRLQQEGYDICLTREPGGTPVAEALRQMVLFGDMAFSWRAEVMAYMAARQDHIDQQILPALQKGQVVLCDRFHDSTLAYQGHGQQEGRQQALAFISALRQVVGHEPGMTLWLDVPVEIGMQRIMQRGGQHDRYEEYDRAFHERVRACFEQLWQENPQRMVRIDGTQSSDAVHEALYATFKQYLERVS